MNIQTTRTGELQSPHIAVMGVSGYAGAELARLLLHHPFLTAANLAFYGRAGDTEPYLLTDLHPQLAIPGQPAPFVHPFDWDKLVADKTDILFLALPHEQSREYAPEALARHIRVIDLSGAWRLHEAANSVVYNLTDADPALAAELQAEAVFGSPELHAKEIASARLVANPGCYSTSIILALAPLIQAGVIGAGKAPTPGTHFMYAADNLSAYKIFNHRHTGELLEQLHLHAQNIQFTPHLLPIPRGILSTIYLRFKTATTPAAVTKIFADFYKSAPLVRLHATPMLPQIQHVVRTNYCDLGFELAKDGKRLVLVSCLDNLLKGAASQAMENMNLMCGWAEEEGLQ